ncbi:MAG: S8 family serine peptidase [Acidobacteria bacterium]|uniref:S8 family serine peptidase n=1 Tax=Candidatus Polarisedimenticola svalbardensis TaxID=2886004 RepID=A0A8J7CC49_9BACT|nr:S8 family serine peptidase [Candidatus Polarisedimenticola svalbardensis]
MRRSRIPILFILTLMIVAAAAVVPPFMSAPERAELAPHVPGEILIKMSAAADGPAKAGLQAMVLGEARQQFRSGAQRWVLGPNFNVERAMELLEGSPLVEYVEPNYLLSLDLIPNDPRMGELWGMHNTGQTGGTPDADIDADLAWGVSTGSHDVLVGVIDTGIDYNHPDLAANVWTNPGEIADNGIDDDGNGYIDDIHGWDFINNDSDPFDDNGHGTHCSGTIGGVGDNGIGVAGVNWDVSIMGLKFLSAGGSGSTDDAVSAIDYAVMMGADLTSNSWGGGGYSQTMYDAIAAAGAIGQAFVAAAGNSGSDNDVSPHYPSNYDLPNVISVAATDHNDAKASFSSYGLTTVDLGAPGVDILSTLPGNSYGLLSGTSMATPHVAGVTALIRSVSPDIPMAQLKTVLLNSADPIPSMDGITVSGARLNAFFAIAEPDNVAPGQVDDLATENPSSNALGLTWTATGDDGNVGTANFYQVRYSTAVIDDTNFDAASLASGAPNPGPAGAAESMEVAGLDADTVYYFALKAFDEWGNAGALSNVASGMTLPPPTADLTPLVLSDNLFTGGESDHTLTLSNVGVGTLDFTIPIPQVGEPTTAQTPLALGKDDLDPRAGDPVTAGIGGPDGFGYRWIDSDEPGGPVFSWVDISGTGSAIGVTGDDATSTPIDLDFEFPFYGGFVTAIQVCTNGWLSFGTSSTAYGNQPLPTTGAPLNLVAPFWDDLNPGGVNRMHYQSFGTYAIVQWTDMPRYSGTGTYTFQAILDSTGAITYQYLSMTGDVASSTVGIQNSNASDGLTVAFNQAFLHDNMAVQISAIPQWLSAGPVSGRLGAGESIPINVHMDASGLEGGVYPGAVNVLTNDPGNAVMTVDVTLNVTGAPDAEVDPAALNYGDRFLGIGGDLALIVRNTGTDVLHVTDIALGSLDLSTSHTVFDLAPREAMEVTIGWVPSVLGALSSTVTVYSNDAAEPTIVVPVTGNALPAPEIITTPMSFDETLFTGQTVTRVLNVLNAGGSDLVITAAADLGDGLAPVVSSGLGAEGAGGPDAFGYSWKDSDESGGPTFNWVDISAIGTPIDLGTPPADDDNSGPIPLGFTFPFYGNNFPTVNVCSNGWLSFTSTSTDYTNGLLPGTSAPENLIAPLHDDLRFSSAGAAAHYYNDGTRFIVQYTDVQKYFSNGSLTFQVILYPNGKIVFQYLTMSGALLNSATVGIQDSTRAIASQMAYNTDYIHDNMAIEISTTPEWMAVTPANATIPPGESFNFDVLFDANDRDGGDLFGNVVLTTNIPSEPQVLVPAVLHVIGVPVVGVIPESYAYGDRFVGYPYLTSFQVVNTGTDVLNVYDVTTNHGTLTVDDGSGAGEQSMDAEFPLPPGASRLFTMRWFPTSAGPLDAAVSIESDDPVNPVLILPVTGNALLPPVAAWSPGSFTEDLLVGDIVNRTLHIDNTGGSDLDFSVALVEAGTESVTVYPDVKVGKGEELPGPGFLGSGGPDVFGYKWIDSDETGGPVFDWFDISAIGTPVNLGTGSIDDRNSGPIDMGMSVPFYGNTFTSVNVCSNGWLSFTSTSTDLSNSALPGTGSPENLLAAFHDDLRFTSAGAEAHYYNDGSRFIVQYTDVQKYYSTGSLTFQVILYQDGRIVYQYLTMEGTLNSATIGIQNDARDDGLTVVYNDAYVHNNMAILFAPLVDWLTLSPLTGTVPAGGFADLDVTFNTTALIGGDYEASIDLTTNDPANALIMVPVNLHVTGIPDIDAVPVSLSFPTTFVGYSTVLPMSIQNVGTDILTITSADVTGDFTQAGLTLPVDLPPGGVIPVDVTFSPTAAGALSGSLVIGSNDPDEAPFTVTFSGDALIPPVIGSDRTSIYRALPPGGMGTETITLSNTGGSDLVWDSGSNFISGAAVTPYPVLDLAKDEEDPRPGILGSGGPDLFGYTWVDSDEPGGPVYDWVDISGVGTQVIFSTSGYSDDSNKGPFPIGFDFSLYGLDFNEVRFSTNGWMSFTNTSTDYSNDPLPSSGGPENLLALFWDDLVHRSGTGSEPVASAVYYHNDGTRFIAQYQDMYRIGNYTHQMSFQVILYPSGKIVYQYQTMGSGTLNSATIGIQNATKDDALMVAYNTAYIHDNMAIELKSSPEWMILDPVSGVIPAGGSQVITVNLDATDLAEGIHEATIDFISNDPATPLYQVPVTLNVNQPPVAMCAPITVETGADNCIGDASIDNGSYDPDGGAVSLVQDPAGPYPLGDTMVTLTVTDETGLSDQCMATVTVIDVVPPELTVVLTPDELWPPNHQMMDVEAIVVASDNCGPPAVVLTSVTSNEADNGPGDGNTVGDIQGTDIGTADFQFMLRAERSAQGTGRIYTATYTATDGSGNQTVVSGYSLVPHDQGGVTDPVSIMVLADAAGALVSWQGVTKADYYNVIRANLHDIRDAGVVYDLGAVTCVEAGSQDLSTAGFEDSGIPASGQMFIYLVEYNDGISSSYGSVSADKPRIPGPGGCE